MHCSVQVLFQTVSQFHVKVQVCAIFILRVFVCLCVYVSGDVKDDQKQHTSKAILSQRRIYLAVI